MFTSFVSMASAGNLAFSPPSGPPPDPLPTWPSVTPTTTTFTVGSNGYTNSAGNRMCGSSDGVYLYQTGGGVCSMSSNSGATWSAPTLPTSSNCVTCACSSTGQYVLFCTAAGGGKIQLSSNYGASFANVSGTGVPTSFTKRNCCISDDGQKMLIGSTLGCYSSTNAGSTWTTVVSNAANNYVMGGYLSPDGNYAAITRWTTTYFQVSTDGMATWSNLEGPGGAIQGRSLGASSNLRVVIGNVTNTRVPFRREFADNLADANTGNNITSGNLTITAEYVPVGCSGSGNVLLLIDTANATNNCWYSLDRAQTWARLGTDVAAIASENINSAWVDHTGQRMYLANTSKQIRIDFGQAI